MPYLVVPFPIIDPVAVHLGPFPLRWYALAYIFGLSFGWIYLRALVAREDLWRPAQARPSVLALDDLLLYCALGVIIGGRLGHVLLYDLDRYLSNPLELFKVWEGGMAFHGGFLGAICGLVCFAWRERLPLLTVGDLTAVAAPIGLFLGRIANFIKPELWGRPSDVPWAMVFPGAGDAPRHPSQLYEAALEGVALGIALWVAWRLGAFKYPGMAAGVFCVGYAIARIFCEFFREPNPVQEALAEGWTKGMAFSVLMIPFGVLLIGLALRRRGGLT